MQRLGRVRRVALVGAGVVVIAMVAVPVNALTGSTFEETDGNLVVNGGAGAQDWANVGIDCPPGTVKGCAIDRPTGQTDDSLGNGTKEDTEVPSVIDGSIPNNKSDLTRFYVANEHVGAAPGKDFLYLAWERVQEPSGTTNMDFEFNQSRVASSNGVTPVRTANDLLVKYDLSQGGTNPTFGIHKWVTAASAAADPDIPNTAAQACEATNSFPCWGKVQQLNGTTSGGSINTAVVSDPIAPNAPRSLSVRTFGEAALNLTDSGVLDPDVCTSFGSAYLKSRSSDSFTAAVKDFIAPIPVDINNCQPATIKLKKVDANGAPLAGAVMQLFLDDGDNVLDAGDTQVGSDCTTALPDGIGTCSFTVTVSGTYIGHEKTAPPGYNATGNDQLQVVTISNVVQTFTLTFTNSPAPGTINILKKDDAGNNLAGAVFTLYTDDPVVGTYEPAGDTDSNGTCTTSAAGTCSFTNVALGSYVVVETTTPAGHATAPPQFVTIGLGSTPGVGQTVNLEFVNPRLHRVVTFVCHEGTNTLDPSSVTLGASTETSIGSVPAALAAKGVTAADLCTAFDPANARFDGLGHGTFSGSVTIPTH